MTALLPFLLLFLVLLILSAYFSCAETAFFSLTRLDLRRLRDNPSGAAVRLVHMLRRPRETLIGLLLGNELTNNAMAVVAAQAVSLFIVDAWVAVGVSVAMATPLVLIFGEMVPKNVAVYLAPRIALVLSYPTAFFLWITTPILAVLTRFADAVIRRVGGDPAQVRAMIVEEEFRHMVDLSKEQGALSESERTLIHGVFTFSDVTVRDVMTLAAQMFRVPLAWDWEKLLSEVRVAQYSRVPVYAEHPENIIGLLYVRDLVSLMSRAERGLPCDLAEIVRPVISVAVTAPLEEVLREFQRSKVHMALVHAADGSLLGLVTMHDLIDTLIGTSRGERA